MVNRSQAVVLGFFAAAVVALLVIRVTAPSIYSGTLQEPAASPLALDAFVAAIVLFVVVLSIGVVRRWRWIFWLIVLAFITGVLRLPAAALELGGAVPASGPLWYVVLQGFIGLVQLLIALALVRGYRKNGVWGAF